MRPIQGRSVWTCAWAVLLLALSCPAAGAQPRVRVVATGGTIANHANGRLSGSGLVASVPDLKAIASVEAETFSSVSSIELSLADWLRLSRRVGLIAADPAIDGIVVTSGSDTLEELAWFLHLTVAGDRPVIVTGAMRRPSDPDADGPRNLADAVRVAVDAGARGRGVLVVVGGRVLRAREVAKQAIGQLSAFGAPEEGSVGRVDDGRVVFSRANGARTTPVFDVRGLTSLPRVDILMAYQQAPGDLVEASIRGGAKGLVIAAAGVGAVTAGQLDAIAAALRSRMPVVVASRVPDGAVTTADVPKGTIPSGTLSPVKARVLLMLALARGMRGPELERLFMP